MQPSREPDVSPEFVPWCFAALRAIIATGWTVPHYHDQVTFVEFLFER